MKKGNYVLIAFLMILIVVGGFFLNMKSTSGVETGSIEYIYVDIKGEVNYPGVYRVSSETRLFQLIEIAGGLTIYADTDDINLAVRMNDEDTFLIPSYKVASEENNKTLININTASLEMLMTLNGIGEQTALNIIDYRVNVAKFQTINDLLNVSGIGSATLEKIRSYITC